MTIAIDDRPTRDAAGQDSPESRAAIPDPAGTLVSDALTVLAVEQIVSPVATAPRPKPWGPLVLAIYNIVLGGGIVVAISIILIRWPAPLATAENAVTAAMQAEATVRFLVLTALGSGFGAVIHNLLGLHIHFAVVGDFQPRFSGSYVLGPIAAAGLGFALFVILQSGLLALGGDVVKPDDSLRPALFYVAIGILTGLAWDLIVLRFDAIARQLFGGEGDSRTKHALEQARKPRGQG